MTRRGALALLAGTLALGGCVNVPRDAGLATVQDAIRTRADQTVVAGQPSADEEGRLRGLLDAELTPDAAVALALARNPRLQVILAELGIARADLIEASTVRNPVLELELRFPADPYRPFELRIAQTLIDLIRLPKRRALGRGAFDAAQLRVTTEVLRFAAEVRIRYFELLAASRHASASQTIVSSAQAAAELAMKQHAAQNITDLDLENEQALYEDAKLDLARAEKRLFLAREALSRDIGATTPDAIRLPSSFPTLPAADPSLEELQTTAEKLRLDMAIARREVEMAQKRIPIARLAVLDELTVDVHYQRDADGSRTVGPGIEIPIPIFDTGRAARTRAEAEYLKARHTLSALQAESASRLRSARGSVDRTRARVEYFRNVVLPRRARIVALTKLEHNAMLVGTFQLLSARQNQARAESESIDAELDYWKARTELDSALNGVAEPSSSMSEEAPERGATSRNGGH